MSWVERRYILRVGQAGKVSWDLGVGVVPGVVDAEIFYVLNFQNVLRSMSCNFVNGEWIFEVICDVTNLSPAQIAQLDDFMNGPNNSIIGIYPPRLISPSLTFVKTAYAEEALEAVRVDLVGRGIGRQVLFYNGNNLEIWTDATMSAGQKNQIAGMWKNRLLDAETGRPL